MAIVFRGDFSSGDLSQWSGVESVDKASRLLVVDAPGRPGQKSLRVLVKQSDVIKNGVRNEVVWDPKEPEGTERWYAWSTYFPDGFPAPVGLWQVWAQWHQSYRPDGSTIGTSPPVEFALYGEQLRFNTNGPAQNSAKTWWSAPLVHGKWLDVVFHVKWSSDPKVGFVNLFIDGKEVVPKTNVATRFGDLTNYAKLGLYRHRSITQDATLFHTGFVAGTAEGDVKSAPSVPPATAPPSGRPPPEKRRIRFQVGDEWYFVEATKEQS